MRDFPIQSVSVVMRVAIEPSKCMVAMSAVREKLNNILFKYNDDMQGVPIAYENVSFPPGKDLARIYGEYPWLHVEVCADVLVFKPTPKESVLGRINKISDSHISILVFGMFNATISADKLSDFSYRKSDNTWIRGGDAASLSEGSLVHFEVLSCNHAHGVFFMDGGAPLATHRSS